MTFSALKLGLVSLAVGLLSAVPPVSPASAADAEVCKLPTYGGKYYCGYGVHSYTFPDGTDHVFVIRTDFSVWTRWRKSNGKLTEWIRLGGRIRPTFNSSDFLLFSCENPKVPQNPWLMIYGLDHTLWISHHRKDGGWTKWKHGNPPVCPVDGSSDEIPDEERADDVLEEQP